MSVVTVIAILLSAVVMSFLLVRLTQWASRAFSVSGEEGMHPFSPSMWPSAAGFTLFFCFCMVTAQASALLLAMGFLVFAIMREMPGAVRLVLGSVVGALAAYGLFLEMPPTMLHARVAAYQGWAFYGAALCIFWVVAGGAMRQRHGLMQPLWLGMAALFAVLITWHNLLAHNTALAVMILLGSLLLLAVLLGMGLAVKHMPKVGVLLFAPGILLFAAYALWLLGQGVWLGAGLFALLLPLYLQPQGGK